MHTRRGLCYHSQTVTTTLGKSSRSGGSSIDCTDLVGRRGGDGCPEGRKRRVPRQDGQWKRRRAAGMAVEGEEAGGGGGGVCGTQQDFFDGLPDGIVESILCKLSSNASCPSDLVSVLITCKRLKELVMSPAVLSRASLKSVAVKASKWSESAHRFLKHCADAGNLEACYTLGMIRFYCFQSRGSGASLMAKAAMGSHAAALYSLAVIQFNGSGGSKADKDLRAGVALCARAAFLGHIDAIRELGHCLQDGYGVRQSVAEGRRFLIQANFRELAAAFRSVPVHRHPHPAGSGCPLLSDFGCHIPPPEIHPANRFLSEWYGARAGEYGGEGLRLCSHSGCGRPETRKHEFRRCSVCGAVNYCSRACQALDWKLRHKGECVAMERWMHELDAEAGAGVDEVQEMDGDDEGGR